MSIILDTYNSSDCITNIKGSVDDNNEVTLTWDWPRNREYNLCVVFETEGYETLEELLENNCIKTVYTDDFNLIHRAKIFKNNIQFKIFPAKKNENQELVYINQKDNNRSQVFLKKIHLDYTVAYKKNGLLSGAKKAILHINPSSELNDGFLYYQCVGGMNSRWIYAIDLQKFGKNGPYEINLNKNEKVVLVLSEQQTKYLTVHERGN